MNSSRCESTPLPGRAVRGSRTGRPTMAVLDLLGRRWALRILWELRDDGAPTFRELQARCDNISSSVLNERLRELRTAAVVTSQTKGGYYLTLEGRNLMRVLEPLDAWAKNWATRFHQAHTQDV